MARVSRPLSDEELAKAERVDRAHKIKQTLEDAADAHLESMAERGEPESRSIAARLRQALNEGGMEAAAALVGRSREIVEQPPGEQRVVEPPPAASPAPKADRRADPDRLARSAYKLLDELWKRWRATAQREGFPSAFRELAMELGESGSKLVEAGMFADMNDLIQCVQRCVMQGKDNKTDEREVDYQDEIEKMKAELRGE